MIDAAWFAVTPLPDGEYEIAAKSGEGLEAVIDEVLAVPSMLKWVEEIEVAETWVADGFDLTQERLKDMLEGEIGYSYPHETRCKILSEPEQSEIRRLQGYDEIASDWH